jgi:hypothetical protein
VEWTSLDPVHIGYADEPSHPAIIWIGVCPSSLLAKTGIEITVHCKHLLSAHGVNNVHVKICESEVFHTASDSPKLYKPLPTSKPDAYVQAIEPFLTALSLPICSKEESYMEAMGRCFISDLCYPDKLFLVTA